MDEFVNIFNQIDKDLAGVATVHALEQLKASYIGKNGIITLLMQKIKTIASDKKKEFGLKINQLKTKFEESYQLRQEQIKDLIITQKLVNETIDVTCDGRGYDTGSLHPVTIALNKMTDIFISLGFDIVDGPEIENDYYNFQALNVPESHPARAMQDTFYTTSNNVLRTHTSSIQIRYAEQNPPPIKIIAPGRVYRVDMDSTHSPMFHQMEGLWIDENITFANLKAVLTKFLQLFFVNETLKVRFRASFFPFTEPSAEVDIAGSNGKWLEVLGCGMVHPTVLENMHIDSTKYSGFAFGIGIDRFAMLDNNITDLRVMFDNDLNFLQQFKT